MHDSSVPLDHCGFREFSRAKYRLSQNKHVRAIMRKSIILNDGVGVDLASLMLYGKAFPQNLNGTDFSHIIFRTRDITIASSCSGVVKPDIAGCRGHISKHFLDIRS